MKTYEEVVTVLGNGLGSLKFHRYMDGANDCRVSGELEMTSQVLSFVYDKHQEEVEEDLTRTAQKEFDHQVAAHCKTLL